METNKVFKDKNDFGNALEMVYHFHQIAFNTINDVIQEYGDIELTEDEQDDFNFCYLEMEGTYKTLAIRKEGINFVLDTVSESGDKYIIDWEQINHDMIIEEMLVNKVLDFKKEMDGMIDPSYKEVRSDYYDDVKRVTCIDAWYTSDDNEEGVTVAYVHDNGNVEWINEQARKNGLVQAEIKQVINDMNKNK